MTVLEPNSLGNILENRGLDELLINRGLGVSEISRPQVMQSKSRTVTPGGEKDRLRIAKAREFGMTKETVGF